MESKWINIQELLVFQEWNKLQSEMVMRHHWHQNWLKVQEIGLEAYIGLTEK